MNSTDRRDKLSAQANVTMQNRANSSIHYELVQGFWTFSPSFTVFTVVAGTLANFAVLRLFLKRPTLRTPLGMYLINLLIVNIVMSCVLEPLNVVHHYFSAWTLGYHACVLRQYLGWTILDAIIFSHFLIAVNRLWAVVFPISYRMQYTVKVAIAICATSWMVINVCFIPTVITITYVTNPDDQGRQGCSLNTDPIGVWGPILQIVFYDLPIALVFLLYPVICYKSFFGTRKHRQIRTGNESSLLAKGRLVTSQPTNTAGQPTVSNVAVLGQTAGSTEPESHLGTNQATKPLSESTAVGLSVVAPSNKAETVAVKSLRCCRPRYGSASGFATLTLMTLSVLVCLAPNEAYFTLLLVVDTDPPGLFEIVKVLQSLTIIFDPILIVLANPELRKLVRKPFGG
ncbi:hypothetical protein RvY_03657-1 [Ramazzottius varieornatus]|uniref:G-protein coupled receptors family 1 profile domain-containing protein n=1 Tax=Ramazzottius varieornatus TaxID=947166 RepID=A0A1D1UNU6_RAMVA|nr:hypothetical protein RvY_03657-1 [Ramazzottius varieornatus]